MIRQNASWAVGLLLALAGCTLTPEYKRSQQITPGQWKNAPQGEQSDAYRVAANWWQQFGSAELNRLVAEALSNNLDLAAARERVGQFRGLAKIAGAPLLPAIGATGSYQFNEGSRGGGSSGNSNGSNFGSSTGFNSSSSRSTWRGQWDVSYEVDLWGGIRAGRDSAMGHLGSSQFTLEALRLSVMGDVAQAYFAIVGLRERKQIAENNLNNNQEVLAIVTDRFDAGAVSALEVAQQKSELANAAAAVVQLDQQIAQAENALAVLLARAPQQFKVSGNSMQAIVIPEAKTTRSETLLDRRPDIRSAEAELAAAHADIGKARAAFYPSLQLTGDNIFTAATVSQPAGIAVALAAALTAPIFQGGRLEGELERTLSRRTELLELYRKTILIAYQEVEDALALGSQATRRRDQLQFSAANAQQAYEIARERYLAGATDYQTLLIVQRSLFNAQDAEIQAHTDVLSASVLLFKALGGGWNSES